MSGLLSGKWQLAPPVCPSCEAPIAAELLDQEPPLELPCSGCSCTLAIAAPPAWLGAAVPGVLRSIALARESSSAGGTREVTASDGSVYVECTGCGAAVSAGAMSPRVVSCQHCSGDLYLPDCLWFALHPNAAVERWYLVLDKATTRPAGSPTQNGQLGPHRVLRPPPTNSGAGERQGWLARLGALFGRSREGE